MRSGLSGAAATRRGSPITPPSLLPGTHGSSHGDKIMANQGFPRALDREQELQPFWDSNGGFRMRLKLPGILLTLPAVAAAFLAASPARAQDRDDYGDIHQ